MIVAHGRTMDDTDPRLTGAIGHSQYEERLLYLAKITTDCVGNIRSVMVHIQRCVREATEGNRKALLRAIEYTKDNEVLTYSTWVVDGAYETLDKFDAAYATGLRGIRFEVAHVSLRENIDLLLGWLELMKETGVSGRPDRVAKRPLAEDDKGGDGDDGGKNDEDYHKATATPPRKKHKPGVFASPVGFADEAEQKGGENDETTAGEEAEAHHNDVATSAADNDADYDANDESDNVADNGADNGADSGADNDDDSAHEAEMAYIEDCLADIDNLCAEHPSPDIAAAHAILADIQHLLSRILTFNAAAGFSENDLETLYRIQLRKSRLLAQYSLELQSCQSSRREGDVAGEERSERALRHIEHQTNEVIDQFDQLVIGHPRGPAFDDSFVDLKEQEAVFETIVEFVEVAEFRYVSGPVPAGDPYQDQFVLEV